MAGRERRRARYRASRPVLLIVGLGLGLGPFGCASADAPVPSSSTFSLEFPSLAAAIGADTVELLVYANEDGGPPPDCQSLVFRRKTGQSLALPAHDTGAVPVCEWLDGTGGALALSGENRLFFVIAQRNMKDYLVGCARESAGPSGTAIRLDLIDVMVPVPTTTCQTLVQKCQNGC